MAGKFGQYPILSNRRYLFKLTGSGYATGEVITNDVFFTPAGGTVLDTTATSSWVWTNTAANVTVGSSVNTTATSSWLWSNTVANVSVTRGVSATSSWFWTNASSSSVTLASTSTSSWIWTNTVATPSTGTTLSTSATSSWLWTNTVATPSVGTVLNTTASSSWLWTNTVATPNVLTTLNPTASSSWIWSNTAANPNVLLSLGTSASSSWLWTNTIAAPSIIGISDLSAFSNWLWSNIAIPSVTTGAITQTFGNNTADSFTGTLDNGLNSPNPTTNQSGLTEIQATKYAPGAEEATAIIFTGLAAIPSDAVITSARLFLTVTQQNLDNQIDAFRLLAPWDVATSTWDIASTGTPWATPGAQSDGVDRVATPTGSVTLLDTVLGLTSIDVTADVVGFVNGTLVNNGWLLERDAVGAFTTGYTYFASSEGADGSRPYLQVTYTIPVIPPVVENMRNGGDDAPHGIYYQNQKPTKRKKSLQRIIDESIKGHYTELTTDASETIQEQAQEITGQYTYNDVIMWESLKDDIEAMRNLIALYQRHLDELDEEEILMLLMS